MRRRILAFLILIAGLVSIFNLSRSIFSLLSKEEIFVQKEKRLLQLKKEKKKLEERLKEVQSPEFIEKEAREKLNLGKRGEVVVILPKLKIEKFASQSSFGAEKLKISQDLPNWKKWYKLFFY